MVINNRDRVKQTIDQLPDEQLSMVEEFLEIIGSNEFLELRFKRALEHLRIEIVDDDDAEWEERILEEVLGDAIQADGTIDYSKVELVDVTLEELEYQGHSY